MLILLPPSETKREGGDAEFFDVSRLRFPALNATRRRLVRQLRVLAADEEASLRALKISPRQRGEVQRNRTLLRSPTLPALDRYTGVVFDALDAGTLTPEARAFAASHLIIQSALLGPIGALDPIPAYRFSHDSRLPGVHLVRTWAQLAASQLTGPDGLILDMRSEAYVALAPVAPRPNAWFVRVVSEAPDGEVRALNHFNKKSKGRLTRALLLNARDLQSIDEVIEVAAAAGIRMEQGPPGVIRLITDGS